jgi:hypothetical protein
MSNQIEYLRSGPFWDAARWLEDCLVKILCRVGIHSNYKHDGEWVDMCAECDYGHPKAESSRPAEPLGEAEQGNQGEPQGGQEGTP